MVKKCLRSLGVCDDGRSGMKDNKWARLLAYITGMVNQEMLLQNEYLAAENRILRAQLPKRLCLSDPERSTLAEIGKRLGRKALTQVACVAKPDTILGWYRRLIAAKFDGSNAGLMQGGLRSDRLSSSWLFGWRGRTQAARIHGRPSVGDFKLAAVLQVGGDAGGAEAVGADFRKSALRRRA